MKYGFYYSLLDWRFPGYWAGAKRDPKGWAELRDYVHAQVKELMTDYGNLSVLWYDGGWPHTADDWQSRDLNAWVRAKHPDILINNRSQIPEDLDTPEQHVTASEPGRLWESCMTINETWGYSTIDREWKTARQLIHHLVTAASGGGNYLLNVGPDPDGRIPFEAVSGLRDVGTWMRDNHESIYESEYMNPGSMSVSSTGRKHTIKGNILYLHCWRWPGKEIVLGAISSKLKAARLLKADVPVEFEQQGHRIWLRGLPQSAPDPIDTVIALEFDEPPVEYDRFAGGGL